LQTRGNICGMQQNPEIYSYPRKAKSIGVVVVKQLDTREELGTLVDFIRKAFGPSIPCLRLLHFRGSLWGGILSPIVFKNLSCRCLPQLVLEIPSEPSGNMWRRNFQRRRFKAWSVRRCLDLHHGRRPIRRTLCDSYSTSLMDSVVLESHRPRITIVQLPAPKVGQAAAHFQCIKFISPEADLSNNRSA
jgi:hypothetical protein